MKLKELKCKNCGANLKVPEGAKEITCSFCKTTYAIEDAENFGYQFEKGRIKAKQEADDEEWKDSFSLFKGFNAFTYIGIFIIFCAICVTIFFAMNRLSKNSSSVDTKMFNSKYEFYAGSQSSMSVKTLLQDVITNNKSKENHKITVKYNDISTTDSNEITQLKNSLNDSNSIDLNNFDTSLNNNDFEILLDYDDKGFVNVITIQDINK